mmetsp:Transcript_11610/g.24768  ORF Transcript_11610/g.24768 Transcript_11610/m.24768 type:complete len:398 (-) Transcript_11610:210-1403(-)|eukprot:CAMPEP_0183734570 /NCGR_PEP_ID=MMETSP0737-20130205/44180_1 /TAXON_ID=385413 /ORGANISM="Thalassiosira miniscula, Strain CCMP1093" /LENGTH=397 /DNA_ID=CAMNT_0025968083 /DNA_START=64 /DNA_END=1257 /DNA_ORIENTATION=+
MASAAGSGDDCATEKVSADRPTVTNVDVNQSQLLAPKTDSAGGAKTEPPKQKRKICERCNFPERTCICPSLPPTPLAPLFQKCRVVVLRHPHELRRKNSSLPLVELCLFGKPQEQTKARETENHNCKENDKPAQEGNDFVMKTVVSRRFGEHCDNSIMKLLHDPNEVILLIFPHKEAMDLEEGIRLAEERCGTSYRKENPNDSERNDSVDKMGADNPKDDCDNSKRKKMTLVFIDSTWKYAREMDTATEDAGEWPKNLIRVQLTPSSNKGNDGDNNNNVDTSSQSKGDTGDSDPVFVERRFQIRAPPSPDHLSTAECLAWIASRVERNPEIYQSVMKTLDYMVELWKGFATAKDDDRNKRARAGGSRVRGFTDGDGDINGWDSMSQKRRKIKKGRSK